MDSFLRKQKPRPRTAASNPPSTLTEAPRAIVRPTTAASLDDTHLSVLPSTSPPVSQSLPVLETLSTTPKPRKRFRKKVSGLFGDQTDLKKRMSKLLIAAHADDIVSSAKNLEHPASRRTSKDSTTAGLSGADGIVARLEEANAARSGLAQPPDEFDTPGFVATASRILGSPEKLQTVRKTMGRLSPRSNERFLAELELGTPPRTKPDTDRQAPITPPDLPDLPSGESSKFDMEREWLSSPVSVERTGAPAVLRRKARRLDRGYRSADVLRARLGGEQNRTRKHFEAFELELEEFRGRARRNYRREKVFVSDQCGETDTDEEIISPQRRSSRRRGQALAASDPFQMLVEVAAVEQKNSVPSTVGGDLSVERHGYKRRMEYERGENKRTISDERQDKKRRKEKEEVSNP